MSATTKVPLSSVVIKTTGGGTPERDNPEFWNGGIPWASVKDFKDGIYRLSKTKEEISEKGLKRSASHLIPVGTPIICTRMAVGRIARASVPVAINQDLRALHIRDEFDTDYVVWAVDSIRHRIENLAIGSTVKGISIDQLLSFEIEAPSKSEQTKIAEILSTVDRAIEQTEALIAKQQRLKTGLMQDLLTRGIDEHGNLRSEQTHKFKDSPLGRIPVEWECVDVSTVIELKHGYQFRDYDFVEHGIPVIKIGNVTSHGLDLSDLTYVHASRQQEFEKYIISNGDVLMSLTGNIGRVVEVQNLPCPVLQNYRVGKFVSQSDDLLHAFMKTVLSSSSLFSQLDTLSNQSAQANFGKQDLGRLMMPLPKSITEQKKISELLTLASKSITAMDGALIKLRSLKTALMQDLLTGRKRVTELLNNLEVPI